MTTNTAIASVDFAGFNVAEDCEKVALKATAFTKRENEFNAKRAKLTQSPVWPFYAVRKGAKAVKSDANQLPVDFGYAASSATMLPSFKTFKETGNPYPANANCEANKASKGYERNRLFTVAHRAIFDLMKDGEARSAQDIVALGDDFWGPVSEQAAKEFGLKKVTLDPTIRNGAECGYSILHALRDMEACGGLLIACGAARTSKTKFMMQPAIVEAAKG